MLPLPEYVTVRETALLVGVTTQAVRERIKSRHLAVRIVDGRMVLDRQVAEAWRAERETFARKLLTLSTGGV